MGIGERIAKLRMNSTPRLTQDGLAKKIGISRAALSHYEKDRREPDYETLEKIADYYDVSTDYLLGRTDKQQSGNGKISVTGDKQLTGYQQEVLDFFMSREDLFFKEKPENILDALEQFEIYYELYKKQQEKKK